ncbi:hypothetical protein GCM10010307_27070 [Streptomyces vastus]|uniref:Helix-turn-helix domain-containing protein n=1 Tax=Streptomyces vastus TaxID=285451 RepID=A0ABN3QRW5_9ACTN
MGNLMGMRGTCHSAQEALRMLAVAVLVEQRGCDDAAAMFDVTLKAVRNWWAKWPMGGWEALVARPCRLWVGGHQVFAGPQQEAVQVRQSPEVQPPATLGSPPPDP